MPNGDPQDDIPTQRIAAPFSGPARFSTQAPRRARTQQIVKPAASALDPICPSGYEILGVLGQGGMGIVYRARQIALNRVVALKMIRAGALASAEDYERFGREAEAVARLHHPNIVQIYEVGHADGNPYFSLEYVEGGTLHAFLDRRPIEPRLAAELLEPIARATHHAHQHGVVHRDLKPVNILLNAECPASTSDARTPSLFDPTRSVIHKPTSRVPKITDFGLARRLDDSVRLTQTGYAAGTPAYMAPEQIVARDSIGPAADVYALGVILYEMLVGRPPFTGGTAEVIHQALHREPVPPHRLQPDVPRDLETICLKCLRKEPRHRYASAAELVDDLRRFLEGRPIAARAIGPIEQARLWQRRNRLVAALLAAVAGTLLLGMGVAIHFAFRANQSAEHFREQKVIAERETAAANQAIGEKNIALRELRELAEREAAEGFSSNMLVAQREWENGQVAQAKQRLRRYEPVRGLLPDVRGFEWHYLERLTRAQLYEFGHEGSGPIAASPDGKHFATVLGNQILIWTADAGRLEHRLAGHTSHVSSLDFDRSSRFVVSAGQDKTVRIHDVARGETIRVFTEHTFGVLNARFAPDGETIVSSSAFPSGTDKGELLVWKAATGDVLHRLDGFTGAIMNIGFLGDGKTLVANSCSVFIHRWDLSSGKALSTIRFGNVPVWKFALAPDGRTMAAALVNGPVEIRDIVSGRAVRVFRGTAATQNALAFSPDGQFLAAAGNDSLIHYYQVAAGHEMRTFRGNGTHIIELAFSPGRHWRLAATSGGGGVKVWDPNADPEMREVKMPAVNSGRLAVSPDGQLAAIATDQGHVDLYDLPGCKHRARLNARLPGACDPRDVCFSPDSRLVAIITSAGTVEFHPARPDTTIVRELLSPSGSLVASVAFSPDGKRFATGHEDGAIRVHDLEIAETARTLTDHRGTVRTLAFHPRDVNRLVSGGDDGSLRFWDVAKCQARHVRSGDKSRVNWVTFSPNGSQLATSGFEQALMLWNAATAEPLLVLEGLANFDAPVVFSPRGDRVATVSAGAALKLFDTLTGLETLTMRPRMPTTFAGLAFTTDGRTLISTARDHDLRLWEAGDGGPREQLRKFAVACRLRGLEVAQTADRHCLHLRAALHNATDRQLPLPERYIGPETPSLHLRAVLEPLGGGKPPVPPPPRPFFPTQALAAGEAHPVSFELDIADVPPGRYRVRLVAAWTSHEVSPIDEVMTEIEIAGR